MKHISGYARQVILGEKPIFPWNTMHGICNLGDLPSMKYANDWAHITYIGKNLTLTMTTMMLHFVEKLAMLEQYYSLGHYYWNWSVIIVRLISCSSMISFSFFFIADLLWTDRMICVNWSNCKPNSCDETAETSTTTTKSRSFKSTIEILSVCVFC